MILSPILFYLFAGVLVAAGLMVVLARNPVHAVLYLVLCFFNAACLFVLEGAEFVAFILMIVYVGAVAVLLLFVVMMLDVKAESVKTALGRHRVFGALVAAVLAGELVLLATAWHQDPALVVPALEQVENTKALGRVLYTDYIYAFQMSGMILLVAMVGAIVLTLRERKGARRQDAAKQTATRSDDVVKLRKVKVGEGAE